MTTRTLGLTLIRHRANSQTPLHRRLDGRPGSALNNSTIDTFGSREAQVRDAWLASGSCYSAASWMRRDRHRARRGTEPRQLPGGGTAHPRPAVVLPPGVVP